MIPLRDESSLKALNTKLLSGPSTEAEVVRIFKKIKENYTADAGSYNGFVVASCGLEDTELALNALKQMMKQG